MQSSIKSMNGLTLHEVDGHHGDLATEDAHSDPRVLRDGHYFVQQRAAHDCWSID